MSPEHVHSFACPETPEHASTPIYESTAFEHGFAPMPDVARLRAEYESQRAAGFAQGGASL